MTLYRCPFEKDLIRCLRAGYWPGACDPGLRDHVAVCSNCRDLVLLTETFQKARAASFQSVNVISPNLLWWRAQLRRRNKDAESVYRPLAVAQVFAWIISLLVAGALLASQYRAGLRWGSWWTEVDVTRSFRVWSLAIEKLEWNLVLLIPTLGMVVLLTGITLYLFRQRE